MLNRTLKALLLLVVLMSFPVTAMDLTGRPDAGGYRFYDSNETDAEPFSWTSIATDPNSSYIPKETWGNTPTPHQEVPIGFTFDFYGNRYSSVYISPYGYITFDPDAWLSYCKIEPIPTLAHHGWAADNFIAGVWGFLYPAL